MKFFLLFIRKTAMISLAASALLLAGVSPAHSATAPETDGSEIVARETARLLKNAAWDELALRRPLFFLRMTSSH